jgi:hypothetical protein
MFGLLTYNAVRDLTFFISLRKAGGLGSFPAFQFLTFMPDSDRRCYEINYDPSQAISTSF